MLRNHQLSSYYPGTCCNYSERTREGKGRKGTKEAGRKWGVREREGRGRREKEKEICIENRGFNRS